MRGIPSPFINLDERGRDTPHTSLPPLVPRKDFLDEMLEVFRHSLKLLDQFPELARQCFGSLFHAMMNVILDELFLGVADGFFHGVQLLRQLQTRPARLEHVDDAGEVSLRSF